MRTLLFISMVILGLTSAKTLKISVAENKLNGTWTPVKQEMGGSVFPTAYFEKQKLIINDSNYTVIAESVDKGVVVYKDDKMDIYSKEGVNLGKHFTAIYKYENEELTICYNLLGDKYPEGFTTKDHPMYFLSVFKKDQ